MSDTSKVKPTHTHRAAVIYIRQSNPAQVEHNRESTERQYELVQRALDLGWRQEQIALVDDDLGVSADGIAKRAGFAQLTADVALLKVGIVVGIEVSRLARNNANWYRLLDLCGITDTLLADTDGIYHPGLFNDRLLLGLKGTMSESFNDVLSGIRHLRHHVVPFSVLMVIDHAALEIGPKRIFDFFAELGIRHFGFNAACPPNQPAAAPGTATDHYVSPAAMNRFLAGIYDCWREYGDQSIEIRELTAIRARVGGEPARLCTLQGGCFGHFFVIEPQGEVAHCDLFLGDRRYTLGNILRDDFDYFRNGPKMAALKVSRQLELEGLRYCPDFQVCNGWCPHQHYLAVRHDSDYSNGCCGLRTLISHIRDSLSGGR